MNKYIDKPFRIVLEVLDEQISETLTSTDFLTYF
jgi:hypothetical protein